KNVNDTYGHSVGDLVLKALAECCIKTLRETDIIARFGGEEFVILLPEIMMEEAVFVANRLRVKISELLVPDEKGGDVSWTVSMGVAESSITDDPNELIKLADTALYAAKEKGRNRVEYSQRKDEKEEIKPYNPANAVEIEDKPLSNNEEVNIGSIEKEMASGGFSEVKSDFNNLSSDEDFPLEELDDEPSPLEETESEFPVPHIVRKVPAPKKSDT
ncbi:MAG: GGDEF domain-containing protein, partial [Alphaproteobacteria bacterium]|nr:GGDEF domain-containing protein [Alphaproteobacteria bacterium]